MKTLSRITPLLLILFICIFPAFQAFAIDFEAEETYKSVFVIYSGASEGSGFAISKDKLITNYHVISNESQIVIENKSGEKSNALLVAKDENKDLAIIQVKGASFTPLKTNSVDNIKVGDDVYAIGSPQGMSFTLTKGVLSTKDRQIDGEKLIQFDAAINPGNSGGPLLDAKGNVIGVNTYKVNNAEGIGLAIPIDSVITFMKSNGFTVKDTGEIVEQPSETTAEKPTDTTETTKPGTKSEDTSKQPSKEEKQQKSAPLKIVLIVSLALNVLLIIAVVILAFNRNKDIKRITTDKDRTDFEIEILE